jgi:hypothetical protein
MERPSPLLLREAEQIPGLLQHEVRTDGQQSGPITRSPARRHRQSARGARALQVVHGVAYSCCLTRGNAEGGQPAGERLRIGLAPGALIAGDDAGEEIRQLQWRIRKVPVACSERQMVLIRCSPGVA